MSREQILSLASHLCLPFGCAHNDQYLQLCFWGLPSGWDPVTVQQVTEKSRPLGQLLGLTTVSPPCSIGLRLPSADFSGVRTLVWLPPPPCPASQHTWQSHEKISLIKNVPQILVPRSSGEPDLKHPLTRRARLPSRVLPFPHNGCFPLWECPSLPLPPGCTTKIKWYIVSEKTLQNP